MSQTKKTSELFKVISKLDSAQDCELFFTDLCTPAELEAMAGRWKAVQLLSQGLSYRDVYEQCGVSTATVTRVARCLALGSGGYRSALKNLRLQRDKK
jgi:TrpR-related protein YerC/YecD